MTGIKTNIIYNKDSLQALREMPADSVHCCVTSPPYYGLRDYEIEGQIGREDTPEQYVERLSAVFKELYRVLRPDGTFWLNISDTYCGTNSKGNSFDPKYPKGRNGQRVSIARFVQGCKAKDLIGIPWLVAFALRGDGWYLRNDIIWEKANPMPESVRDRCSRSYEHVFLFTKSRSYYFDPAAIAEPIAASTIARMKGGRKGNKYSEGIPGQKSQLINQARAGVTDDKIPALRNKRDVWHINTIPYRGNHFAAFPPKLAETCILAGCPESGIVIDPFLGSGTTGLVAKQTGRRYIGIDINAEYCRLAHERIGGEED